jgi:hypothetical protein
MPLEKVILGSKEEILAYLKESYANAASDFHRFTPKDEARTISDLEATGRAVWPRCGVNRTPFVVR